MHLRDIQRTNNQHGSKGEETAVAPKEKDSLLRKNCF